MKTGKVSQIWSKLPLVLLLVGFSVAFGKVYIKTQTTLLGYRIGQSKQIEAEMLESQSTLKMELAKLTTRESLVGLAGKSDVPFKNIWAVH